MYTKDKVKLILIEQLELFKQANLPHSVTKLELDPEGRIISFSPEKMVRLDEFSVMDLELLLKQKHDENIVKFIIGYLVKAKSLEFIDKHFEELFEEFQLFLEKGELVFRGVCLVHGIELKGEGYSDGEFSIKKVNRENLEYFYNHVDDYKKNTYFPLFGISEHHLVNPTVMIEVKKVAKSAAEFEPFREKIIRFGQAILLSNGVSCNLKFSPFVKFSYLDNNGIIQDLALINELRSSARTTTELTNISEVTEIYDKMSCIKGSFIPIERFSSAHNKKSQEDKFLDLMIALEALFPSINMEQRYRLRLSTAILLGKNIEIFNRVGKLYDKRSRIVHGASNIPYDQLKEDVTELGEIVRKSILIALEYLKEGKKLADMEEDITKNIFSNQDSPIESI